MSAYKKIRKLYNKIPSFECIPGCTDCCGPIPFAKSEWNIISDKRQGLKISNNCPYSLNSQCDIYDQRPLICRLFGASLDPLLKCPHGCRPDKPLTKKQSNKIRKQYIKLMHEE